MAFALLSMSKITTFFPACISASAKSKASPVLAVFSRPTRAQRTGTDWALVFSKRLLFDRYPGKPGQAPGGNRVYFEDLVDELKQYSNVITLPLMVIGLDN